MREPRVCVLLSTYNGEKYLRELLDSVLHQTGVNVHILVRDDGSTDATMWIVSQYQDLYKNIHVLESSANIGAANSFMELLYQAGEYDYYAFADQDDIWKPGKLLAAVKLIQRVSDAIGTAGAGYLPEDSGRERLLYCSNQTIFEDGTEKGLRYQKEPNHTVTQVLCANHISGTTLVMNRALREYLVEQAHRPDPEMLRRRMHDVWVVLAAQLVGKVIYDSASHILYRVHDENQVGLQYDQPKDGLADRVGHYLDKGSKGRRADTAREALKLIPDVGNSVSAEDVEVVRAFAESGQGLGGRLRLIRNKTIKRDCEEKRMLFVVKALLGWH